MAVPLIIMAAALFISAGTASWLNGWLFVAVNFFVCLGVTVFVLLDAELLAERMGAAQKTKLWDKILVPLMMLAAPLLMVILAGLDERHGNADYVTGAEASLAFLIMLGGNAFSVWAMKCNRYFSSFVRVQNERGQCVIDAGPYRHVRHPAYLGGIVHYLAAPVLLGSVHAYWASGLYIVAVIARTALEDHTLKKELSGYRDYAQKVRYRLFPFIW